MAVPQDREQWSESSKRSYAYHYSCATYEDISYHCQKCGISAIFTAEEQKIDYEIKKQYIWRRRILCDLCNGQLHRLRALDKLCQARWAKEKHLLRNDQQFLAEWLTVLETIPMYKQRYSSSMAQRLEKLLKASNQIQNTDITHTDA